MSDLHRKLASLPDKTVIRFQLRFTARMSGKPYTYSAVYIRPDWFVTGDMPTLSSMELSQTLNLNGHGDIDIFPPRDYRSGPQILARQEADDEYPHGYWEAGDY